MAKIKPNTWIDETLYKTYKQSFLAGKIFCDVQTQFQHVTVFESKAHGKVLMLDGIEQLTEKDEYIYHEMIAHVPLCAHPKPKKILIIGGGDGGVARRVLMHEGVKVTLVEIDPEIIKISKKYLQKVSAGAFANKNVNIIHEDGVRYVEKTTETFDVIITDRGDDVGPGHALFQKKFYNDCKRCLNKDGILVALSGVPFFQRRSLTNSIKQLQSVFRINTCFLIPAPTYIGGSMAITWSSNAIDPYKIPKQRIEKRYKELKTEYYNPNVHFASFALPNDIIDLFDLK